MSPNFDLEVHNEISSKNWNAQQTALRDACHSHVIALLNSFMDFAEAKLQIRGVYEKPK